MQVGGINMATTKDDIKQMLYYGKDNGYSHMLMVCDTWDYTDYPVYVEEGENIDEYVKKHSGNMQKVMEVYHYDMDLDAQLQQNRAWNKCAPKPKTIAEEALEFAKLKHKGQTRKTGEEYIVHPLRVAELLLEYKNSHNMTSLVACAYLHDVLEDTDATYYELVDKFGYEIASIVQELTNNEEMKEALGKERYLSYKLTNMTKWALVIKLCDRLANIETLADLDPDYVDNYVHETRFIIDYLCEHRDLTQTHKNIIKRINKTLEEIKTKQKVKLKVSLKKGRIML